MDSETVLVVDDQASARLVLEHCLRRAGFTVVTAKDGREALELMASQPEIKALVTDCDMPELCGLELSRRVRERIGRTMPIVMVTAMEYSITPEQLCEAGVDFIVGKPFSPREIVTLIREVLTERKRWSELKVG